MTQKLPYNGQKSPKMVINVQANGPNEARNTNTKLPDIKWQKIATKNCPKMAKMTLKWPKNYPQWPKMA